MPDLSYPGNHGCAGAVHHVGGSPHACDVEPVMSVVHRYRFPRPHDARLLVCRVHGEGEPDPQPLTDADRAELARRRRVRDEALARRDANRRQHDAPPGEAGRSA